MSKMWTLTRVLLKNGGSLWETSAGKKRGILKKALLTIALLMAILPLMSFLGMIVSAMYDGLAPINQEGAVLGLGLTMVSLILFLFGIFYAINVFYYSQDVENLLPLPLKPWQIVSAKFLVVLLYEYLTQAVMLFPVLITFGLKSGAGLLYYVYSAVLFLALPFIPLVLAALVAMLFMRVTNVGKNKDRSRLVGGIALILLTLGINFGFQRFGKEGMKPEELQQLLLAGDNSILHLVTQLFPTSNIGALTLIHHAGVAGLGYLLTFLLLSAVCFVLFAILAERLYFKGVMGISESTGKRKRVSGEQWDKLTVRHSVLASYTAKEMRLLLRTPAYFLNCVFPNFLWPGFMLLALASRPDSFSVLAEMGTWLQDKAAAGSGLAIASAFYMFTAAANSTSATSISREGRGFFVNKYLPVPIEKILVAKVLPGTIFSVVAMIVLAASAALFMKLPPLFITLSVLLGLPGILFINLLGIMIDLHMPKLNWDTEQKAVKQNLNGLVVIGIGLVVSGLSVWIVMQSGATLYPVFFGLFGLFAAVDLFVYRILVKKGPEWFEKIEA
jgi:ABC-2 type transport system permease protein